MFHVLLWLAPNNPLPNLSQCGRPQRVRRGEVMDLPGNSSYKDRMVLLRGRTWRGCCYTWSRVVLLTPQKHPCPREAPIPYRGPSISYRGPPMPYRGLPGPIEHPHILQSPYTLQRLPHALQSPIPYRGPPFSTRLQKDRTV